MYRIEVKSIRPLAVPRPSGHRAWQDLTGFRNLLDLCAEHLLQKKTSQRLGQNQDFKDMSISRIFFRQVPKTES